MSHFFIILVQIPYIILSLICGVSLIISNWNEFVAQKNHKKTYMLIESSDIQVEQENLRIAA